MSDFIQYQTLPAKAGQLGLITLHRPAAMNAINLSMVKSLQHHLSAWAQDSKVLAVIITARPGAPFCAGGDIRAIYQAKQAGADLLEFFWHEYRLNHTIFHYPKPYIALLDGLTMGGGVGIALHGNCRIAGSHFQFAMPETAIGFFPDIGGSYLLSRIAGSLGLYAGLTGRHFAVADCAYLQVIDHFIDANKFSDFITALQQADWVEPHRTVDIIADGFSSAPPVAPLAAFAEELTACFSKPSISEICQACQASTDPRLQNLPQELAKKSPTSLMVTLQQLHKARTLNFDHCLQMEYDMVKHFLAGHDFFEGIRAMLIDKDKTPRWSPPTLGELTPEAIAKYFQPSGERLQLSQ